MYVGRDDRAALLACFDETAPVVFGTLCQLCAGDAELAVELLGETYTYLGRMAASSYGVDVDQRWMIDAAHSVYAAHAPTPGRHEVEPVASLAPNERVIVHLHDIERRGPSEIALLLGATIDDVERSLANGRAALASPESGTTPADAFRHGDVWFDDTMRTQARARIGDPPAPSEADDHDDASSADPAHALMSRRTMIGAGATASIAALIGVGLWLGSSDGDSSSKASELPDAPDTTTNPSTTAPRTTTPATDAIEPTTTDDTIVLGTDTTTVFTAPTVPETGFIVDPVPEGFSAAGGYLSAGDENPFQSWFQLWASVDAAHTAGRWLAIDVIGFGWRSPQPTAADMQRLDVGGHPAVVRTAATGVLQITTATDSTNRIEVHSYGLSIDQIGQLIASMTLTSDNEPQFAAAASDTALDGLDLRISRIGNSVGQFGGDRSAQYLSADGEQQFNISAGPQQGDDLFAAALVFDTSTDPVAVAYAPEGTVDLDGRHVLVLEVYDNNFLLWHAGSYTLTVSGNVPIDALFDLVANTRLATEEEWEAQINAVATYPAQTSSAPDFQVPEYVAVTQRDSSSDPDVVVRLGSKLDESGRWPLELASGNGTIQTSIEVDPNQPITVYIDIDVTIIIAVFEAPGPMKKMRVSVPGRPAVIVPLVPLGDDGAYGAAYAFSELGDFGVALVDTDGTLIQEFDV